MKVIHIPLDVNYVNSYLAVHKESRDAFLVDCGKFDEQIKNVIRDHQLNLKMLLLTHTHYDHTDGVKEFRKAFKAPIYSASPDYDYHVSEGEQIAFGESAIEVLATPGHTHDSISFHYQHAVFVGDAIFSGAVGGTSSRSNFEEEIKYVRTKVLALPDNTMIYPGHGAPTMVGVERLFNPFFR
ncbi:MAG: hydroxyacylglutathione hydrolase family protein [bacterium]